MDLTVYNYGDVPDSSLVNCKIQQFWKHEERL